MDPELVLSGLFLHLRRQGLPLGPRDFLDALAALRSGFGSRSGAAALVVSDAVGPLRRGAAGVAQLFAAFPQPTPDEVEMTRERLDGPEGRAPETVRADSFGHGR